MRMPRVIRRMLRKPRTSTSALTKQDRNHGEDAPRDTGPSMLRRWDAARTHRLNKHQFENVIGQSINQDLAAYLETLRTRCEYEAARNPLVEGVITTHATDVVGKAGPRLQVQSDSPQFNEAIEGGWRDVFAMPDPNCRMGGAELLRLWIRQLWTGGEFLTQYVSMDRPNSPVTLGLKSLQTRRLYTPGKFAGDPRVALGVRLTKHGKPTQYYIEESQQPLGVSSFTTQHEPVPADMMLHRFYVTEPDQIRGVPWLAGALQVVADLRDYDRHVLEAAKNAAAQGITWFTDHPDAEYIEVNESIEYESGTEKTGPPGWKPMMVSSTQPTAQYQTFRHERLRELGRPVNMPLMMVLLSSADSNFASAHYDGQIYIRGIQCTQSWLDRLTLNPIVAEIARELRPTLAAKRVKIPTRYTCEWTWNVPPYVNPKQMYDSLRARLEDGTASYSDVLGAFSLDIEGTIAKRVRENEMLEKADLPPLPINVGDANRVSKAIRALADQLDADDTGESDTASGSDKSASSNGAAKKKETANVS